MANIAILRGGQVVDMFAGSHNAIVTGCTVIHNSGVIKHCSGKRRSTMAVGAIYDGGNMTR